MAQPKALDLFCAGGGISVGLARAGFDVTGVDCDFKAEKYWRAGMEPYGGEFICADFREVDLAGYDFIHASPPCQGYSSLRHLTKGKMYPKLVEPTRELLEASGALWSIENVPGAPLGASGWLIMLCGTMFGLQTPDGRAEIRRHRLFETSFSIPLRPACQHGYAPESLSVCGTGMRVGNAGKEAAARAKRLVLSVVGATAEAKLDGYRGDGSDTTVKRQVLVVTSHSYQGADAHSRRRVLCVAGGKAMSGGMMTPQGELKRQAEEKLERGRFTLSVTGGTPQTNVITNQVRETFSREDAGAAMGIPWLPMRWLSQAIPPAYAEFVGREALFQLSLRRPDAAHAVD